MKKQSGIGIASLIVGIISLLLSCVGVGIVGIVGIILSVIALTKKENAKGMAIAGLVTSILGFIISLIIIGAISSMPTEEKDGEQALTGEYIGETEEDQTDTEVEETEKDGEEEKQSEDKKDEKEESSIEDGMERISSGEYLFITNEDLDKYCANMEGVKVYVVTEIDDMKEDMIQSNLSDGYMMSNFHFGENYEKYESQLNEGDVVGISGIVSGNDGYGFMGKSVNVEDCLVFAVGDKAEKYKKDNSDEGLSEYFVATEEVADSGEDISEEEYKALCENLDYEDILRNPDNNKGKYCKVEGTVAQIVEGWFGSFTIYVTDYNGNKWGCVYSYGEGESRLLEGDSVTMYGKCKGTENTETIMGKQVTLPRVDVEYIN